MRKFLAVVVAVVAALSVSACATTKVSKGQQTQAEKQAQALVQKCLTSANLLTKSGREGVIKCIAPPGHTVQFEACAQKAVEASVGFTGINEAKLVTGLSKCVESDR